MRSKFFYLVLLGMVASLAFASTGISQNAPEGAKFSSLIEAKSVMSYPLKLTFVRPAKNPPSSFPVVSFDHSQHDAVACKTCHHTWAGGNDKIQSCTSCGCHENFGDRTDSMSYFKAFHSRDAAQSCLGCHIKLNEERKAHGKPQLAIASCTNSVCHVTAAAKK